MPIFKKCSQGLRLNALAARGNLDSRGLSAKKQPPHGGGAYARATLPEVGTQPQLGSQLREKRVRSLSVRTWRRRRLIGISLRRRAARVVRDRARRRT